MSKMIEKFDSTVFSNDDIVFGDLGFDFVHSLAMIISLMKIILMIVIQKLLVTLELWRGILDTGNAKHLKRDR